MKNETLINELNRIRIEQEKSILYVATSTNMPYPGVYEIFKGQRTPQIDTLEKILNAMGYKLVIAPKD